MHRKPDRPAFTRIVLLVTGLGLSMGLSIIAQGQTSTVGSISGTVRDPQGAVIVNETVTVYRDAALVETSSANVSSLISEKQVAELPLSARNYAQFALMVPGVSPGDSFNARGRELGSVGPGG